MGMELWARELAFPFASAVLRSQSPRANHLDKAASASIVRLSIVVLRSRIMSSKVNSIPKQLVNRRQWTSTRLVCQHKNRRVSQAGLGLGSTYSRSCERGATVILSGESPDSS